MINLNFYGLDIPNKSNLWNEIKLRAVNNYGNCGDEGVDRAIEAVSDDYCAFLKTSKQVEQLKKEIREDQA